MISKEKAVLLGPRRSMVAIVSQGSAAAATPRTAVVILNAGIIHRIGANRSSVMLARAIARLGFTAVRLDLSGIGDSEPRSDGLLPIDANHADIKEALDSLTTSAQCSQFVLIGLCAGADRAILYAGLDARVVGAILIDPFVPRTLFYYLHHYGRRLVSTKSWLNIMSGNHPYLRRLLKRLAAGSHGPAVAAREVDVSVADPERTLEEAYRRAIANGVQLLAVLTGGMELQHNYRKQLQDAFRRVDFRNNLLVEYFDEIDHTFMSEATRGRLVELILGWLGNAPFGSGRSDI